jgi:replicative superfamily II helicase
MLTLLQLIGMHRDASTGRIDKEAIKAVYIAPMKALAQEVVAKFSERLAPLGLVVKEFTGDMQLTKQEVADSQLLVCTPEKYDVVTRKGGDKSLGTLVSLIIIDEVHLLADERGAVIETIVARTQRYVESSQKLVSRRRSVECYVCNAATNPFSLTAPCSRCGSWVSPRPCPTTRTWRPSCA